MANLGDAERRAETLASAASLGRGRTGHLRRAGRVLHHRRVKQPVFRDGQQPDRHPSEHNLPRLPVDRGRTCPDGRRDRHFGRLDLRSHRRGDGACPEAGVSSCGRDRERIARRRRLRAGQRTGGAGDQTSGRRDDPRHARHLSGGRARVGQRLAGRRPAGECVLLRLVRPGRGRAVPHITILFLIVALIAEIALRWTSSGFRLLAIGSNPQAARLVGFHVERTRVLLLAFSGFIAGLSGVCSVAYLDTASPTAGTGYELSVLAAVIIGGVKLTGGRGSILGVLLGLCVIGIFQNLIVLWGVSPNWTQGVSGLVLIAAMTLIWLTRGNERAAGG